MSTSGEGDGLAPPRPGSLKAQWRQYLMLSDATPATPSLAEPSSEAEALHGSVSIETDFYEGRHPNMKIHAIQRLFKH